MEERLQFLIESLREELKQYGEMLAQLDLQQDMVMRRQTADLVHTILSVNAQTAVISNARHAREHQQRLMAQGLNLPETAAFYSIIPLLPADYRPLVQALVQENNELLVRVQQRARQNHLLLSHAVELMQTLINSIFPGANPKTYDESGRLPSNNLPQQALYEAVG